MQIHHVISSYIDRYVLDSTAGPVMRHELVMKESGAQAIVHEGKTYPLDEETGTFDVPEEVGQFYISRPNGNGVWREGPNPFYMELEEEGSPTPQIKRTARSKKKVAAE